MAEVTDAPEAAPRTSLDSSRARLEQLQRASDGEATVNLTQKEYVAHIEKLERDLYAAWSKSERVRSLRIAIQVGAVPVRGRP